MNELFRILILQEIERIWQTFKNDMQPNGVWIAEHRRVPADFLSVILSVSPERVYFLDKTGIAESDASEYASFINFSETPIKYKNDRAFDTGLAMFAELEDGERSFYFCYQFGKLFGKGYCVKFDDAGEFIKYENIWVS